jgi:F0F1-type ATP synthase membrane subunit c/vacuolar-type H+-ATPase subunit K
MAKQEIVSKTFIATGLASVACGFASGFCNGTGINFQGHLESYLMIGPTVIQSFMGILDGTGIAKKGKQVTGNYPILMESELSKMIEDSREEEFINGELYGGLMGWFGEGLAAGVETLAGYGIGYLVGRVTKSFS